MFSVYQNEYLSIRSQDRGDERRGEYDTLYRVNSIVNENPQRDVVKAIEASQLYVV